MLSSYLFFLYALHWFLGAYSGLMEKVLRGALFLAVYWASLFSPEHGP